jgi:hypothetical protein
MSIRATQGCSHWPTHMEPLVGRGSVRDPADGSVRGEACELIPPTGGTSLVRDGERWAIEPRTYPTERLGLGVGLGCLVPAAGAWRRRQRPWVSALLLVAGA